MKVLVTGATGFIGGNLARELWSRGHEVRALVRPGSGGVTGGVNRTALAIDGTGVEQVEGDILDATSVRRAVSGCQGVFHCAAAYTFWARHPAEIYRVNVDGTSIVLDEARRAGVDRVVYTSTVSTIGLPPQGLGDEDCPLDPRHLVGHYKKSKHRAEQVALKYAEEGLPVVVVNPTAPFGPWDVKPTPTGKIVLSFLRGRAPAGLSVLVDTGMNAVDVADVAAGHILALERGEPGQRYVLGNRNVSLAELYGMLAGITGRPAPTLRVPLWAAIGAAWVDRFVEGVVARREPTIPLEGLKVARTPMYVSCEKAVSQLGLPQHPVEDALARAVRWFTGHGYAA